MFELFLMIIDAGLLVAGIYFLYWHRQIDVRANYSGFQLFFAAVLAMWFVTAGINNLPYIVMIAAFITLVILAGNSGLTPTRVIASGVFSRVIPYTKLTAITLTPLSLPDGRELVVAIFNITSRRFVRLTFRADLNSIITTLRPRLPEGVKIAVQHVQ
ncbi:hypothetical protein [Lacticaseibacillus sp. GG6-2]